VPGPPGADSTVPGPPGSPGATGPPGSPGVGVPAGGTPPQILTKQSATDYDAQWQNPPSVAGVPPIYRSHVLTVQSYDTINYGPNFTVVPEQFTDGGVTRNAATITISNNSASYRHVQPTGSTSWVIPHNLGYYPNVAVVDSAGTEIFPGTVQYDSVNQITLTFSSSVGGEAYLS